jgi:hypothetical protein
MANLDETTAAPPAAEGRGSQKMLQLLRKRLRQLLWGTLGLFAALVVISAVFGVWWLNSLNGLPDIGAPFDVAEFQSFQLPDDQNAFTFLRRADQKLTPLPNLPQAVRSSAAAVAWSKADPKLRKWAESNRPVLDLFQQAANQSDGLLYPVGQDGFTTHYAYVNPDRLAWVAFLEASRREEAGDPAGAWECYRAILRVATHFRRRGDAIARTVANRLFDQVRVRLESWVADKRTTVPLLRQALDEVIASQPRPEWDAFSLKQDYQHLVRILERPRSNRVGDAIGEDLGYRVGSYPIPPDLAVYVFLAHRFALREPERSVRAVRLVFANWLAHVEDPALRKNPPIVRADSPRGAFRIDLYPVGPQSPAGARVLTPRETAKWLVTTMDAKSFLQDWYSPAARNRERRGYANLILALADELYRREHGADPPSDQALLGSYLQTLPDDGSADMDQGNTPVVTEFGASDEVQLRPVQ